MFFVRSISMTSLGKTRPFGCTLGCQRPVRPLVISVSMANRDAGYPYPWSSCRFPRLRQKTRTCDRTLTLLPPNLLADLHHLLQRFLISKADALFQLRSASPKADRYCETNSSVSANGTTSSALE